MLQRYLKDIVDLESEKRITGNSYNRLTIVENDNTGALGYKVVKSGLPWGKILKKIIL